MKIEAREERVVKENIEKDPSYKLPDDLECSPNMQREDWKEQVDKRFREVLWRSAVDPRLYPLGKLAIGWMLGRGDLQRSGQASNLPVGTVNNFFVSIRSEADVQRLLELGRSAASLPEGTPDGAITLVPRTDIEEDQGRCAVVVAECDQDVQPAVVETGV